MERGRSVGFLAWPMRVRRGQWRRGDGILKSTFVNGDNISLFADNANWFCAAR